MSNSIRISILGSEAAGKTCFLAGLAILKEANREGGLVLQASGETLKRLDFLGSTLRRRSWPPPTTITDVYAFELFMGGTANRAQVKLADYPGEDFKTAIRSFDASQAERLIEHVRSSDVLFLFFDPHLDIAGQTDGEELIRRHDAFLQTVVELTKASPAKPAVAVVLTKADTVLGLLDSPTARQFFQKHLPVLDQKIHGFADSVEYFPVSAVGNTVDKLPGQDLVPRGYRELFQWAFQQPSRFQRQKRNKILAMVVGFLLLCLLGYWTYTTYQHQRNKEILENDGLTDLERLERTDGLAPNDPLQEERKKFVERLLKHLKGTVETGPDDLMLTNTRNQLQRVDALHLPVDLKSKFTELKEIARKMSVSRSIEKFVKDVPNLAVPDADKQSNELSKADDFNKSDREELNKRFQKLRDERKSSRKEQIKKHAFTTAADGRGKVTKIKEFIRDYEQDSDVKAVITEIRSALHVTEKLWGQDKVRVKLTRSGELVDTFGQSVKVVVDTKPFEAEGKKATTNSFNTEWNIDWNASQSISAELWCWGLTDFLSKAASVQLKNALSIVELDHRWQDTGRLVLPVKESKWKDYINGNAYLVLELAEVNSEDIKSLKRFIHPGTDW